MVVTEWCACAWGCMPSDSTTNSCLKPSANLQALVCAGPAQLRLQPICRSFFSEVWARTTSCGQQLCCTAWSIWGLHSCQRLALVSLLLAQLAVEGGCVPRLHSRPPQHVWGRATEPLHLSCSWEHGGAGYRPCHATGWGWGGGCAAQEGSATQDMNMAPHLRLVKWLRVTWRLGVSTVSTGFCCVVDQGTRERVEGVNR